MKDKSPVNPINQNTDQVGINPYSPDQFKKPEKIKNEESEFESFANQNDLPFKVI